MKKTALVLTLALLLSVIAIGSQVVSLSNCQTSEIITIKDNGSIEGTNQIQSNGNIYTLTSNISGTIQVKKSNIIIDGAGFTLNGNNGTGIDISSEATEYPSELDIWNVTVKNLRITNFKWGIHCSSGGNHTFYGNYISNDYVSQNGTGNLAWDRLGILFWGSSGNNISHCTIGGSPAIYMHFIASNNFVIENNIVFGADLRMSGVETFDGNFWSDYSIRYPNASAVDSSGVWNMPYVLADSSFDNRKFQDSHPLVNPLAIPNFQKTLPIVKSVQEPSSIPIIPIALGIVVTVLIVLALLIFWKKHKERKQS